MFRRCNVLSKVGAYSLFMKESAGHPNLLGLTVPQRGKTLHKLFTSLSASEKKALDKRASSITWVRKPKAPKAPRKPSAYNKFVKKNWSTVQGTAPQRLKAIAKQWQKA